MLAACSADVADAATRVEAMADVLGWGVVVVGATATGGLRRVSVGLPSAP